MWDKYLDVDGVSKELAIHPESVRRLIRRGFLPAIKIWNKCLVEKDGFYEFAAWYKVAPNGVRNIANVGAVWDYVHRVPK